MLILYGLRIVCLFWLYVLQFVLLVYTVSSSDLKQQKNGDYTLIGDAEENELGYFDKPLPFFGFGIGWFWWAVSVPLTLSDTLSYVLYQTGQINFGSCVFLSQIGQINFGFCFILNASNKRLVVFYFEVLK